MISTLFPAHGRIGAVASRLHEETHVVRSPRPEKDVTLAFCATRRVRLSSCRLNRYTFAIRSIILLFALALISPAFAYSRTRPMFASNRLQRGVAQRSYVFDLPCLTSMISDTRLVQEPNKKSTCIRLRSSQHSYVRCGLHCPCFLPCDFTAEGNTKSDLDTCERPLGHRFHGRKAFCMSLRSKVACRPCELPTYCYTIMINQLCVFNRISVEMYNVLNVDTNATAKHVRLSYLRSCQNVYQRHEFQNILNRHYQEETSCLHLFLMIFDIVGMFCLRLLDLHIFWTHCYRLKYHATNPNERSRHTICSCRSTETLLLLRGLPLLYALIKTAMNDILDVRIPCRMTGCNCINFRFQACCIGGGIPLAPLLNEGGPSLNFKKRACNVFMGEELMRFLPQQNDELDHNGTYALQVYTSIEDAPRIRYSQPSSLIVPLPLHVLVNRLPKTLVSDILAVHKIPRGLSREKTEKLRNEVNAHDRENCQSCHEFTCVFVKIEQVKKSAKNRSVDRLKAMKNARKPTTYQRKLTTHPVPTIPTIKPSPDSHPFPPKCNMDTFLEDTAASFCTNTEPSMIEEVGCSVCGMLTPKHATKKKENADVDFTILCSESETEVTRRERQSSLEPIKKIDGPVMDSNCSRVCMDCVGLLKKKKIPLLSLANGNWIGDVPSQLKNLSYAERLLIAKVRPNYCVVRVESGMKKMHANAVLVPNPTAKIYETLPPHRDDLDDVMAFVYTGPTRPSEADLRRTPFLVRRRKITAALEWLKLNHCDYADLNISEKNLNSYENEEVPVTIEYHKRNVNKYPLSTSIDDLEEEMGTEDGDCPFIVHGLIGEELDVSDRETMIAEAIKHMELGGKSLGVGHAKKPASIFNNPQLYPQAFPWLFPYGLGGLSNQRGFQAVPEKHRLRQLVMYYDKRFQNDSAFILIAFNHTQIKASATSGFLLTEKATFPQMVERIMDIDKNALKTLATRLRNGEYVKPTSPAEKQCYQIIKDIDHIAGHVEGSGTTRKFMNREAWSLVNCIGAPTWYITFAPADEKHPIALYYAGSDDTFYPKLRSPDERRRLIASNPAGSARFFHKMVEMFLKHVLKIGKVEPGLWGKTKGYYGTVEQQGRLTLHLHLLLWIEGAYSPQDIRERLLSDDSEFQKALVDYLEDSHSGDFLLGDEHTVKGNINEREASLGYQNPTLTLPSKPPVCNDKSCDGPKCQVRGQWWTQFKSTVDDLLFRSNRHVCRKNWCLKNRWNSCKARFPRRLFSETICDDTGHISMKKKEPMINTFNSMLTYLLRCNTDVTSLLSGTSIKAVIAYVTDYVTKSPLKTYNIFETICDTFDRNAEMLNGDNDRYQKARSLLVKIVNGLTTKMQIGSPMASSYLLGLPDHYTSHEFKPCRWRPFVKEVVKCWPDSEQFSEEDFQNEKVVLQKINNTYVAYNMVLDYTHRPCCLEYLALYDWFRLSEKRKITKRKKHEEQDERHSDSEDEDSHNETYKLETDDETDLEDPLHPLTRRKKRKYSEICSTEKTTNLRFSWGHPQRDTHSINLLSENEAKVPNFLGVPLPRIDCGSQEYYHITMLTLFKPWRTGGALKRSDQTWNDAFESHNFTPRQKELMGYFNIQYECLDAKDDYNAQMKQRYSQNNAIIGGYQNDDENNSWSTERDVMSQLDVHVDEDILAEEWEVPSNRTLKRLEDMNETERRMQRSGWYCGSSDYITLKNAISQEEIESNSKLQWKQILEDKKQETMNGHNVDVKKTETPVPPHTIHSFKEDEVKIIDHGREYCIGPDEQDPTRRGPVNSRADIIIDTARYFNLRPEQGRAFGIIAGHHSNRSPNQLKMYIGGMAGTGKSQVVKALKHFFSQKGELHHLEIVAPTGSAAALIDGSTYHSLLGFQEHNEGKATETTLNKVKQRLRYCKYILLDEVSMLSCQDLYDISKRLSLIMNRPDEPFGGINMILCGDFAQLPPVKAKALWNHEISPRFSNGTSTKQQECLIGKVLWHQFTTVVILRENMRQRSQKQEDKEFRKSLENMRYKACTKADIDLLKTCISNGKPGERKLEKPNFRHVSVITSKNRYRDKINEMGTQKYAAELKQPLTDFYSIDTLTHAGVRNRLRIPKGHKISREQSRGNNTVHHIKQRILWNLSPDMTQHKPGKLPLCVGMPVLIKKNIATECCVTNGAEATVVGWKKKYLKHHTEDVSVLDVLFVKLTNPPRTIRLNGLPENVVPLTPTSSTIECQLPNGDKISVCREQIDVLPNFAMTDYASQGRTRPDNVIDLTGCSSHMSYYTCFSRSSTISGTVIVGGFNPTVIQGGASGWLRQEFRELEILDEITRLRESNTLHPSVRGDTRNVLLTGYRNWKGVNHVPENVPAAIRWSSTDPLDIQSEDNNRDAKNIRAIKRQGTDCEPPNKKIKTFVSNENLRRQDNIFEGRETYGTPNTPYKRKHLENDCIQNPSKKQKASTESIQTRENGIEAPEGMIWNNNSCAFDAFFTILINMWKEAPYGALHVMTQHNMYLRFLLNRFEKVKARTATWEQARDETRTYLAAGPTGKRAFGFHRNRVAVVELIEAMLTLSLPVMCTSWQCNQCQTIVKQQPSHSLVRHCSSSIWREMASECGLDRCEAWGHTQDWFNLSLIVRCRKTCRLCRKQIAKGHHEYTDVPSLLVLSMEDVPQAIIDPYIEILMPDGNVQKLKLAGVIYFGREHFTARIIDGLKRVWYHDGLTTRSSCIADGKLDDLSHQDLWIKEGRKASNIIYAVTS